MGRSKPPIGTKKFKGENIMAQDTLYCYTHPEEFPYEVTYYTENTKRLKIKYFRSTAEIKAWVKRHRNATIGAGSWQVFAIKNGGEVY